MNFDDLLFRLAVALAIGLPVGLERGWQARDEGEGERAAGLRTFAITGLLGGVAAALVPLAGGLVLAAALLGFTLVFAAFHYLEARAERDVSATGVVAGMLTFTLGAYAVLGELRVAAAGAVVLTGLLALKQPLHAWLQKLEWKEIRAGLVLLAMTFLLLPVLPDRTVDPWQAINPAEIWLLAIIIAALSFVGYGAVRIIGDRAGIVLVALAGGLASSTAVTVTLSRLSKESSGGARVLAGGVLLAGAVMVTRVFVVASSLNGALLMPLAAPFGATLAVFLASALLLLARREKQAGGPALELKNPLELGTALKLAAFIAVVMLVSKLVAGRFGDAGIYVVAALSGIADVDALTLSLARLPGIEATTAATGIAIAVGVNSVSKCAMAAALGSARLAAITAAATALALATGLAALLLS